MYSDKAVNSAAKLTRMPDAFVILFFVILLAGLLTYLLPAGQFDTQQIEKVVDGQVRTQTLIVPDSFTMASEPTGISWFSAGDHIGVMNYAFEGMVSGSKWGAAIGVIAFILVVGGAFGIIMSSGAVNNGIMRLIKSTQHADKIFIPLLFTLFSLAGAIFGMGEEAIAFCIVLVPLIIALGYDGITAVLVTYVATQIGFATSWMNPFSVAIAQGIADVPLMSGSPYRMALWGVFTLVGLVFTLHYSARVKADPERSLSFASDDYFRQQQGQQTEAVYQHTDSVILLTLLVGLVWVIWGVTVHQYYIPQIASQFFVIGIVIGIISCVAGRMSVNEVSSAFQKGAKDLLPAALIVGMAKGIILILGGDNADEASVLNTLLYYAASVLDGSSEYFAALFMLVFQSIFNFFIASGSGQAALTMPLMAPLSDLINVSRQVAVLAFQLGDGLTNIIIPTSASLIGCLGVVRLDWSVWVRFAWKLILLLFTLAVLAMIIAVYIGYQ